MKALEVVDERTECDRCPARALHLYVDPNTGLVLAFCGHHSGEHGPALDDLGWRVIVLEGASK